jgi:DNA polymerase elongation subunit (family B)
MSYTFRLLTFSPFDKQKPEEVDSASDSDGNDSVKKKEDNNEYLIQMFGINEKGETASIMVTGYTPFFYVKVDDSWTDSNRLEFISTLRSDMGQYYENSIFSSKMVKRKKLYGFDGGIKNKFILIQFDNEKAMKKAKNLWYTTGKNRKLKTEGYWCTQIYEANIPPMLRMFHIRKISPSGWIELPKSKTVSHSDKSTTCNYEYTINYKNIKALPDKETLVPYKIASFDIEASSSHGDFPLAKKNYKKLATNIIDKWDSEKDNIDTLRNIIYTAFKIKGYCEEDVDIVYPKKKTSKEKIDLIFTNWTQINLDQLNISDLLDDDMNDVEERECDEGRTTTFVEEQSIKNLFKSNKEVNIKKGTIINWLNDSKIKRDIKLAKITKSFEVENMFPPLRGDEVTFIGTTFVKYGEETPYLNHCIVKNTCDALPQVKNSVIESYKTEKQVLLAWTKLIKEEDPDIVIGYNIFGFDYIFMYERAQELDCVQKFLELSRNKEENCESTKWQMNNKTNKLEQITGIEQNSIYIASGQHDIKYIKMNGRLQVDMYNYFRREFQLSKYKLDYVSGYFIGDYVKKIEFEDNKTKIYSKNLTGLENNTFISFEEEAHSVDQYKDGEKFEVFDINYEEGTFYISGNEEPDMTKKVRWGVAKDDVTPQDIFRMTNEGSKERSLIAKYCIQDCNLVHHLMRKIDVITGYVEMANLCSVPLDFLVMRGQGIKLTSYIAKKCREKNTLIPVIEKGYDNEGFEGAIVLEPKCDLYLNEPVACVDYSSLYPSSMISENISHDSKVWTKEYTLDWELIKDTGEKNEEGKYIYDNLPNYKYVDITYDTFKWQRKNGNPSAAMEKVKSGYKTCRFAQFPEGKAVMPSILEELLRARKSTRKLIPQQKNEFMKNVLDKRQLSIKLTANSLYGQTGAKTSSFYEKDCAASTTATGRKLLTYAKRIIEEAYCNRKMETTNYGTVITNAEYVYGDTDSVFFKFNLTDLKNKPIIDKKALEITIELAKQAGELASKFLKNPHDLEYEKTFLPFCLLSKKRYVGMLYEEDPNKCKRKSMGIVLKRRDNAPIVKDVYGGIIDILMKEQDIEKAVDFLNKCLRNLVDEKYGMDKLVITKSLRSGYKNPKQIAHKVLADRIGKRDPGNKPSVGDRVAFVYIEHANKKALQGEKIETPEYIIESKLKINYSFYITNQLMKPIQQVFALVLEKLQFRKDKHYQKQWMRKMNTVRNEYQDEEKYKKKIEDLRNKEVKAILFDKYLIATNNMKNNDCVLGNYFPKK